MIEHRIQSALVDLDLSVERIDEASRTIDPLFRDTPQYVDQRLGAALGRRVIVKVETANPLRSFKGRGTDFLMGRLPDARPVVCESTGNFGQGIAYAARARGIPAEVFAPLGGNPAKLDRIRSLGATVIQAGTDGRETKAAAREHVAAHPDRRFIEDGRDPEIAEGAGTIAVELLRGERPDTIVVPVGDGALITGIARWVKEFDPGIRIVGVCATGAPSLAHSWRAGRPVATERADTFAEGIKINDPVPASVTRMAALVDDMVLIDDSDMVDAIRLAAATLGLLLEPSGAAGLAAIARHYLPGDTIATVLTGSNINPSLFKSLITQGESR